MKRYALTYQLPELTHLAPEHFTAVSLPEAAEQASRHIMDTWGSGVTQCMIRETEAVFSVPFKAVLREVSPRPDGNRAN